MISSGILVNGKQQQNYTLKLGQSLPNQPLLIKNWLTILNKKYNNASISNQFDSEVNGQFKKIKFQLVCQKISKWNIQKQLTAYSNYQSRLLIIIKDVSFPYLRSLNVWENNIESVQVINYFDMPNLEQLWIWRNNITDIKSLRRVRLPKLQVLDIKNNFILDHSPLSEIYLANNIIQRVDIGNSKLPLGVRNMAKFPSTIKILYPYFKNKGKDGHEYQLSICLQRRFPKIVYN